MFLRFLILQSIKNRVAYVVIFQWSAASSQAGAAELVQISCHLALGCLPMRDLIGSSYPTRLGVVNRLGDDL